MASDSTPKTEDQPVINNPMPPEIREHELRMVAQNIVNQLFDISNMTVDERQAWNDRADDFVMRLVGDYATRVKLEAKIAETNLHLTTAAVTTAAVGFDGSIRLSTLTKTLEKRKANLQSQLDKLQKGGES